MKKNKEEATAQISAMKEVGQTISQREQQLRGYREEKLEAMLLLVPNLPHESTPVGKDEAANIIVRHKGEPPQMTFKPAPHWELRKARHDRF